MCPFSKIEKSSKSLHHNGLLFSKRYLSPWAECSVADPDPNVLRHSAGSGFEFFSSDEVPDLGVLV